MRGFLVVLLMGICLPSLVLSQLACSRCYGNSFCNNASHPDYATGIRQATCNVQVDFENDDPIELKIQQAINAVSLKELGGQNATLLNTWQEGHCITATVHEPHDSHTLRTCVVRTLNANVTTSLCELIKTIISPLNWYEGNFTCRTCNGSHFCNNFTLNYGDGLGDSRASYSERTASFSIFLGLIVFVASVYEII
ncbi:uncharacterized protein LOC109546496 [Dendroctonus ponderosae]